MRQEHFNSEINLNAQHGRMLAYWLINMLIACGPYANTVCAADFESDRQQVMALAKLTAAPVVADAAEYESKDRLRAVYYEGLPWQDNPTKVFAWLGLPTNTEGKVPGIVLVHGGGGSAFKEWVQLWNDHGFAAISIAVEGQTDKRHPAPPGKRNGDWKSHRWAGPKRDGIYGDSDRPIQEQWMYHAVADTILANSLLRSLPEVDADKVGLMGISWGGIITSTVVGIDSRLAFGIPTYGCGHLAVAENQYGTALGKNQVYQKVWDPLVRMDRAHMPLLWLSWPNDKHFPLDCQAVTYRAATGARSLALIPGLKHGHGPPWKRAEGYVFAKNVVAGNSPWCRQLKESVDQDAYTVSFEVNADQALDKATLVSTTDQGITGERNWIESSAKLVKQREGQWLVTAQLPKGITAWFVNVHSGELIASSEYQERPNGEK